MPDHTDIMNEVAAARADIARADENMRRRNRLTYENVQRWGAANATALNGLTEIETKVKNNTNDMQRYAMADLVGMAIGGMGESIVRMSRAFDDGRNHEGGAEVLRMVGSLTKLTFLIKPLGAWAGPIGSILSEIFAIGIAVLEGYGPEQKPIGEQLKKELVEHTGDTTLNTIEGVLDAFSLAQADMIHRKPNSMSWSEIKSVGLVTDTVLTVFLGAADDYLRRHPEAETWGAVLESYTFARSRQLQNVLLCLNALRKFDGEGRPTEDLIHAQSVLDELCKQCEEFLREIEPITIKNGTRWFIGSNSAIYMTKHGTDTRVSPRYSYATKLAVSGRKRVWHLGGNKRVYTVKDGDWYQLPDVEADDFWLAPADGQASHFLWMKAGGSLQHGRWDDALSGDARFSKTTETPPPYDATKPPTVAIKTLTATPDGLYVLDTAHGLWVWDARGSRPIDLPYGAMPDHLSADADTLYIAQDGKLWSKRRSDLERKDVAWQGLDGPDTIPDVRLPEHWKYLDLFAAGDGSVLTILDETMYSWFGGEWSVVDRNTAKQVVKVPVEGHEMFVALRGVVADVREVLDRMAHAEPQPAPLLAPALVEVTVGAAAFAPSEVTIRAGGEVHWKWSGYDARVVIDANEQYSSPQQSTGSWKHTFVRSGEVDVYAGDAQRHVKFRGKIIVK